MTEQTPFPDWTEECLVADAAFAAAYDAVGAPRRAELKLALARLAACLGEIPAGVDVSSRAMRQGFHLMEARRTADFTVIFWDAPYAGPTRILAALMPAILAGVPHILACRVRAAGDAAPFPAPVLAALELASQELTADISPDQARDLMRHCGALRRAGQAGRAVFLGAAVFAADMERLALEEGIPAQAFAGPVTIGVAGSDPPAGTAAFREGKTGGILGFAHPDARFVPADAETAGPFDAVFCAEGTVDKWLSRCPLTLAPGHEACWIWPGLTPEFFMDRSLGICP